jgi:manganese/zinc/iron transport system permease protein
VVLILSVVVLVSLLFAPGRGIVWRRLHLGRLRSAPKQEPVLMHLYALSLQHPDNPFHGHNVAVVQTMNPADVDVVAALEGLERRSLAQRDGAGLWSPTELGRREAEKVMDRGRRERS